MRLTSKGYAIIRSLTGVLSTSQVKGIECIVQAATEAQWTYPQCAYALATVYIETADTFEPVTEYGSLKYLQSKNYYPYIGRGLVQITWEANYAKFSKLLGVDLVKNMDKALELDIALQVMIQGMSKGLFTGVGYHNLPLRRYNLDDYTKARSIINGADRAKEIAGYAILFERALRSL